jgi:hypothetical protein
MRANGNIERTERHKRLARAVSIALVLGSAALTAGCAHVGSMFGASSEAGQKPALRKPAPPKPKVAVTPAMRAEAEALRVAALDQMSRGAVGPAVTSLTKAAKLDPTNEKIRTDLDRAIRARNAAASRSGSQSAALD